MATGIALPINNDGTLAGHLLIATSVVQDSCFARSVIYLCAHSAAGAMGIIVNYPVDNIGIKDVFAQLSIPNQGAARDIPIHFGGPVEANRGFVVHSADSDTQESLINKDGIAVTASVSILQKLAEGQGPAKGMLVLGYAGWSPGQLEAEIEGGSWIVVPASTQLVFDNSNATKWTQAISSLGFDVGHFSSDVGHA